MHCSACRSRSATGSSSAPRPKSLPHRVTPQSARISPCFCIRDAARSTRSHVPSARRRQATPGSRSTPRRPSRSSRISSAATSRSTRSRGRADGELVDPWAGGADLDARVLRHVSPAFSEDPLRVLRVARFAARFEPLGFTIAAATHAAHDRDRREPARWRRCAASESGRRPSRRWATERARRLLRDAARLRRARCAIFPEVDALFGVPQPERWHPEIDTGVHTMMALRMAARLSRERDGALRRA